MPPTPLLHPPEQLLNRTDRSDQAFWHHVTLGEAVISRQALPYTAPCSGEQLSSQVAKQLQEALLPPPVASLPTSARPSWTSQAGTLLAPGKVGVWKR